MSLFNDLLQPEVQAFIRVERSEAERNALAFQPNPFPHIPWQTLLTQINSRHKCRNKLPMWFDTANIIYPPTLSVEQSSSEPLAQYKAQWVQGQRLMDATGGMGVDCWHMAQRFAETYHFEIQPELSSLTAHNMAQLGGAPIRCQAGNSIEFLRQNPEPWDWIYLDPARRHDVKGKIFRLEDSEPQVLEHLPLLLERAQRILLKTSPLLDIHQGIQALQQVHEVHVVAYKGEVKELLWFLGNDAPASPLIQVVELHPSQAFHLTFDATPLPPAPLGPPAAYLYEPHPVLMKAGTFDALAHRYGLRKLHPNSHLFTADVLQPFPGKVYHMQQLWPYHKKTLSSHIKGMAAHVVCRNFPESVDQLRHKWRLGEAESPSLFFTTLSPREGVVILAEKITMPLVQPTEVL